MSRLTPKSSIILNIIRFLCHVLIVFFGEKVVVQTSNMQFVNKKNVYLNISLDVFGAVSSALMNQLRERLTSDRSSGVYHCLYSLSDETLNRGPDSLWSLKIPWHFS